MKYLKDFWVYRVYILHSHDVSYVLNAAFKDVLVQPDPEGRRGKWIATMLEYDLEIKPTKLIKGKGLAQLMVESKFHVLDINIIIVVSDEEMDDSTPQGSYIFISSPWY